MSRVAIDKMLSKVDSRFTLVIEAAKRARQINDYFNAVKRHEMVRVRPPRIGDMSSKPLTIAFQEIAEDRVVYERTVEGIK